MTGPHHCREARARRPIPVVKRQARDWVQVTVTALPGLAAVIALMFSYLAVQATGTQLQITEQGQITDRYNNAITNLGSASTVTRLGCIYALQRIMQDSSRDQSTVIAVLCGYIRDQAPASTAGPRSSTPSHPGTDVQAALTVIGSRPFAHERPAVIDLDHTQLAGAVLNGDFNGADLSGADLADANLTDATLVGADLTGADLTGADLAGADLAARSSPAPP
jgi:Pentapeptide repeats (8 copies)